MSGASALALMDLVLERAVAQCSQGVLLELGAYKGRSAALLAHHAGPARPLHVVEQTDNLQLDTLREIAAEVVAHPMRSEAFCSDGLAAAVQDRGIVASHHDASHFFEGLVLELQAVAPLVHRGGVIVLGNFNDLWSQVRAAYYFLRFAAELPFEALVFGFNKCVLVHQSQFARWEKFVLNDLLWELRRYRIDATLARTDNHPQARAFHLRLRTAPDEETLYGVKFWGDRFYRPTATGTATAGQAAAAASAVARPRDRGDLAPAWFDGSDGGAAWRLLCAGPVQVHVVGGSPAAQRDGWAESFIDLASRETGHAHRLQKTAMAGAGLLYGLARFRPAAQGTAPAIVLIETGADDVAGGQAWIDGLGGWLASLLTALRAGGMPVLIVHGVGGGADAGACAAVHARCDRVAATLGVPVIRHDALPQQPAAAQTSGLGPESGAAARPRSNEARACAAHLLHCLQAMARRPGTPPAAPGAASPAGLERLPALSELAGPCAGLPELCTQAFVDGTTGQGFDAVVVPAGRVLRLHLSGRLLAVAHVAADDSARLRVLTDAGATVRAEGSCAEPGTACYRLLPLLVEGDGTTLRLDADPRDARITPGRPPAPLRLLHLIGVGLRIEAAALEPAP